MQTLDWLLHGNVVSFLALVALIVFAIVKMKLGDKLDKAKENVVNVLEQSDKEKIDSEKTLTTAKKDAENLPDELNKIKEEAKQTISSFKATTEKEIEETIKRLEDNADKVIDNETQKISLSLQKELAKKAILSANENTLKLLNEKEELHRKYIAEAIDKIEEINI